MECCSSARSTRYLPSRRRRRQLRLPARQSDSAACPLDCRVVDARVDVLVLGGGPAGATATRLLCGIWQGAVRGVEETHTLVEAYDNGWVWSIPLARDLRYVTVMTERGGKYHAELAKTHAIRGLLRTCIQRGKSWGCDASLY